MSSELIVYVVGLSSTEAAVFAAVSRILRLQDIHIKVAEKPDNACQLIIIHTDSERGNAVFERLKGQKIHQHLLLIANKKPDLSKINISQSFLSKPLRVQELLECLEKLSLQLNKARSQTAIRTGTTASPNNNNANITAPRAVVPSRLKSYRPSTFNSMILLTTLLDARDNNAVYQIANKHHGNFWVNGVKQEVISSFSPEELFKLIAEYHTSGYIISTISIENFKVLTENKVNVKLDDVLWYAAMADKRGQLIENLDENTPVKLTSWPNMTRLSFDPSHIRMAAVLSRQAETLNDLVSKHQLSRLDTVCFLNAAYSIHILEKLAAQVIAATPVKQVDNKKSSLLHKIANHLHIRL